MSELSIFIDESGDYGPNSDFYLLTLVFHDQRSSIDAQVDALAAQLQSMGESCRRALHTGPMVRKEDEYGDAPLERRRKLFALLFGFARKCGISYKTFAIDKRQHPDPFQLKARLAREVSLFFQSHTGYFTSFDRAIAYYDNGQAIVTNIVNTVFGAIFFDVEIRRVRPSDYRLFQCADLICTLELLKAKESRHLPLSRSEEIFFESRRKLKKNHLKQLERLSFEARQ